MKRCPYCGYANYDVAQECRRCQSPFRVRAIQAPASRSFLFGPDKAHTLRSKALSLVVLGLMVKVFWGGYGPWPVPDDAALNSVRTLIEPLFLTGGLTAYCTGWILRWI
jgi:divalent metal cation (Fe/Co/Zn/Cd) transporter